MSILTNLAIVSSNKCLTILRPPYLVLISLALFLGSCGPGNITNHYESGKSGVSGGGATKDPGDGTGGGTGDGGGGQGVICGSASEKIISNRLMVRDVYEAISNHKRSMISIPQTSNDMKVSDEAIEQLVSALKKHFGPASENLEFTKEDFWKSFSDRISFVEEDRELYPSKDANSPIALAKSCKLVQIAFWDDSPGTETDGKLYVSRPLWKQLDQLNKVALLAHEYLFKLARKGDYKNSDLVRLKVGELLSVQGLTSLFRHWQAADDTRIKDVLPKSKKGYKFCEGSSKNDPVAKLQFYQYEGTDGLQHFVFPLIQSKNINMSPFANSSFTIRTEQNSAFKVGSDLLVVQSILSKTQQYTFGVGVSAEQWLNWRVENSGLLSTDAFKSAPDFIKLLTDVRYSSDPRLALWEGQIETPSSPIKITIKDSRNSEGRNLAEKQLKSKEDLLIAINSKIRKEINSCGIDSVSRVDLTSSIAVLNMEVDAAINAGTYPNDGFTKWNLKLSELQKKVMEDPERIEPLLKNDRCEFTKNEELRVILPFFLYNVKINNYSTEEAFEALTEEAFYSATKSIKWGSTFNSVALGQAVVSKDQDSVEFELFCQDYTAIHNGLTQSSLGKDKNVISPNATLKVKLGEANTAIPDYDTHTSDDMLLMLGNHLTTQTNVIKGDIPLGTFNCHSAESAKTGQCDSQNQFALDLKTEKGITIDSCADYGYDDSEDELHCAIVSMENSGNSFLIRFAYSQGWKSKNGDEPKFPQFMFVQQIPGKELYLKAKKTRSR